MYIKLLYYLKYLSRQVDFLALSFWEYFKNRLRQLSYSRCRKSYSLNSGWKPAKCLAPRRYQAGLHFAWYAWAHALTVAREFSSRLAAMLDFSGSKGRLFSLSPILSRDRIQDGVRLIKMRSLAKIFILCRDIFWRGRSSVDHRLTTFALFLLLLRSSYT